MSKFKDWFNEDDHDLYNYPEEAMEAAWNAGMESQIAAKGKQEWISVDDRLPQYGEAVLLAAPTVQKVIYMLDGDDGVPDWFEPYFFDHDNELKIGWNKPTHWMPLPDRPSPPGAD